jgi:hypothetical protein
MKRAEKPRVRYSIASLTRAVFRRGRGFAGRILELPARLLRCLRAAFGRAGQQRQACRLGVEILEPRYVLSASVWTDKSGYAPGETATINASSFGVGETVDLKVVRSDGATYSTLAITDGGQNDLDGVVDGNIQATWVVPNDSPGYSFQLTATGETSAATAQTSFAGLTTWVQALPTDYSPGQTANITAGGFSVGETVDFHITNISNCHVYPGWSITDGSSSDGDGATDGHIQTGWFRRMRPTRY